MFVKLDGEDNDEDWDCHNFDLENATYEGLCNHINKRSNHHQWADLVGCE